MSILKRTVQVIAKLLTKINYLFQVIDSSEEDDPEFRYLNTDCGIQPSKRNNYGIPMDVIDMFRASNTNSNDASNSSNEQTSPNTLDDVINNRLENVCIDSRKRLSRTI